jgi:hypothetical protein
MLSGDVLMRQVHQLAQVLARALMRRQTEQPADALDEIASGWRLMTALGDREPTTIPEEDLLAACNAPDGRLHPETALLVADLLALEGELLAENGRPQRAADARRRALMLLRAASRHPEAALPIDLFERIERLEELTADCS